MSLLSRVGRVVQRIRDARTERRIEAAVAPERGALQAARAAQAETYRRGGDPLVSITIPTYQRGELLARRTLPSALAQTYRNIEVVVVGDHCTDDTAARIAALGDSRVRFENLAERGSYPADPRKRWMVAGSVPLNHAIATARGEWLCHMDDDDVYAPDKVERLLRFAQERDLEFAFGRYRYEKTPGVWMEGKTRTLPDGRPPYGRVGIPHSGILYRAYLRCFPYYVDAWRYGLPTDNLRWLRMGRAGVRWGFLDHEVCLVPLRPGESAMAIDAVGV